MTVEYIVNLGRRPTGTFRIVDMYVEFLFQMYEFVPNTICLSVNASGVSEDPLTLYLFKPVGERVPYIDQA